MKIKTAAVSATQASSARASGPPGISIKNSISVIGVPIGLPAATIEKFRRYGRAGSGYGNSRMPPTADDQDHDAETEERSDDGNRPGQAIEAVRGRLGQYGLAVFLNERLQDQVVVIAGGHALVHLFEHGG